VVIRALELWKKHLPAGSEVEFQNALQGSIIVNNMLANKQQIGYLGDMPAVVATTKRSVAPIDLVANTGLSPGQRCNVIMVRADAPKFSSPQEGVKWLDGKTIATPQGSCAHRFLGLVIEITKIKPASILNQSIEVIATNLRAGKIDGAVLWEPSVSRIGDIVGEGSARIVATGHTFGISDAGAIAMREDFMKQRPDIVEAWLKTELEAQQYVIDPKNWTKVAEFVKSQTAGISVPMAVVLDLRRDSAERGRQPDPRREAIRVRRPRAQAARGNLRLSAPNQGDRRRQAGSRRARRLGRTKSRPGGEGIVAAGYHQGAGCFADAEVALQLRRREP
jgi:NitT/TauT family transport system substrate-binding protein